MPFRQDRKQPILLQIDRLKFLRRGQAQKATVHAPLRNPHFDLRVIAHEKLVIDPGIILLKHTNDVRQPMRRHAGKRADADQPALHAAADRRRDLIIGGAIFGEYSRKKRIV